MVHEPESTLAATNCVVHILDANYEKADLQSFVRANRKHQALHEQNKLLDLLTEYKDLCDSTLGGWKTEPVSLELRKVQNRTVAELSQYQKYTKQP